LERLPDSALILNYQKLNTSDVPMIISMITPDIANIELMCNRLVGSDISALCKYLEISSLSVLTTLNLAENDIGDEGARVLGYYLIEPECKLHSLTVSHNNITDKGGQEIASSLAENSSLEILNFDCNQLTDVTLFKLEQAVNSNPKCPLFNLSLAEVEGKHLFTKAGAKMLWKLMNHCPELTITGDPPFTLGSIDDLEITASGKKQNSKFGTFHDIAAESIQRMRMKSSLPLISHPDYVFEEEEF